MAEERLTNIVTSTKPCPICASINGMTMTLAEWEASPYGLPGSDGRYCDGACHCVLIPDSLLGKFDWIDPNWIPRGDEGSRVRPIVEIFPNEKDLADLMNNWNLFFGRLPKEIYSMSVKDGFAYLKKLFAERMAAGGAPPVPPPPLPPPPPAAPPPTPVPPSTGATPKKAGRKPKATNETPTGAELKTAKGKASFAGQSDAAVSGQIAAERKIWAMNEKEKAGKGPAAGFGREWGTAIDKDGNMVLIKKGRKTSVHYEHSEMVIIRDAETFLHNHPQRFNIPNSFSDADVGFMVFNNIKRMVVNTCGRRYTLLRPGATWYAEFFEDDALYRQLVAQGASEMSIRYNMARATDNVERYVREWKKAFLKNDPPFAEKQAAMEKASAPFAKLAEDAFDKWKKLNRDPNSTLTERDAAYKEYRKFRDQEAAASDEARQKLFYAGLDKAVQEFAEAMNIQYYVEDWD